MTDKIALFFTKDEILDTITTLEEAQFEVEYSIGQHGDLVTHLARLERTQRSLADIIYRFNLATSATSGLTNDPDGWYNG